MIRRRGAAWVALLAGAVGAVTLAVGLVHNLVPLAVALASLLLAVAAAWYGATRHGARRVAGVVCIAAALVALVVAIVEIASDIEMLLVAVSVVVIVVAARAAVAVPPPATEAPPRRARGAPRAVLLVNPKSGGGKAERFDLVREAANRGVRTIVLERGDDLRALAVDAARTAAVIGMAGGDGSQAIVADVASSCGVAFVCIPAGTRNHFALDLGIDRDDVVGALDGFTGGIERKVDIAYVNEHPFVNNVSLGVYAQIVQSDEYRDAKRATVESMLPDLLGPDASKFDLRFSGPDGRLHETAQLVLISNNEYVVDRLSGFGTRAHLDGGVLGIVALELETSADVVQLVALDAIGRARSFEGWTEWCAQQFEVDSGTPIAVGVDGEASVLGAPLRFEIQPSAVRVHVPPQALTAGSRPAARELWQTALGKR
jgi:diacylglycerol kinase family enzyme